MTLTTYFTNLPYYLQLPQVHRLFIPFYIQINGFAMWPFQFSYLKMHNLYSTLNTTPTICFISP
jgi:hypothetical protein